MMGTRGQGDAEGPTIAAEGTERHYGDGIAWDVQSTLSFPLRNLRLGTETYQLQPPTRIMHCPLARPAHQCRSNLTLGRCPPCRLTAAILLDDL